MNKRMILTDEDVTGITITRKDANKYSDSQPRDKEGQWTSTGAGGYVAGTDMTDELLALVKDRESSFSQQVLEVATSEFDAPVDRIELELVARMQGFDGKPQTITQAEFDEAIKNSGQHAYRGLAPYTRADGTEITGDALVDEFVNGNYFAGGGIYGSGTYVAANKNQTDAYMMAHGYAYGKFSSINDDAGKPGRVISMVISDTAKIADYSTAETLSDNFDRKARDARSVSVRFSTAVAAAGYDGYRVGPANAGVIVMLNRTALKVVAND